LLRARHQLPGFQPPLRPFRVVTPSKKTELVPTSPNLLRLIRHHSPSSLRSTTVVSTQSHRRHPHPWPPTRSRPVPSPPPPAPRLSPPPHLRSGDERGAPPSISLRLLQLRLGTDAHPICHRRPPSGLHRCCPRLTWIICPTPMRLQLRRRSLGLDEDTRMRLLPVMIPMEISRTPRGTLSIRHPLNPHPQSIPEICLNFPCRFVNL
jgi:hypothetical protein